MKIAIIGAGAGGLAAAFDLLNWGHEVTLYEASEQVGGLAAGFKEPQWEWSVEQYYHHWFASDKYILSLIEELGLSDKVLFQWPTTVVFHRERFYPLDGPLSAIYPRMPWLDKLPGAGTLARGVHLLRFPALSLVEKARYAFAALYLLLVPSWKSFEKVTAYDWLGRWMGKRVLQSLWEPLLVGKFGPHYKNVNMAWFWARVKARTPRLGTFEGGFQAFMDAFADHLKENGAEIKLGTPVLRIEETGDDQLRVETQKGSEIFDQCLVTSSPTILTRIVPTLPQDYLGRLQNLKSMGAVVLVLALRHRLSEDGVYWHNLPKSAGFPFLAMVEHTNFLSPEYFGGDHIIYCGDYLEPDHEYFEFSKEQLLDLYLAALPRFNPAFKPDWVRKSWLFRTPYAQPVPPLNHSASIPDLKTPIAGLWFASMSQVYPWDRGTNFAVGIGRRAARRMVAEA
ncbi:MAG: NAD(P)/FAD-dependent oxidoreductase [Chloroflexi bacterium]|nr:NAD(P)/FAD-dependent oxidoreductase [Chloroflexota bacterium]